jgi:N-methylhydantoinase A
VTPATIASHHGGLHVGVDIGGTFTDTIAIDESGLVLMSKVPTTPANQAEGFVTGLESAGIDLRNIAWIVHGTTVGTNATLERNGARCGMITTKGFRDILELGRRERPELFGLKGTYQPLVPREFRLEVTERLNADGTVRIPLDELEVEQAVLQLKNRGVEALLICFLNSYANRQHEQRAAEIASALWPNSYITQSVDILAEFREVERFGTAAVNAYIQPLIDRYIGGLTTKLKQRGMERSLSVMQANGGIMSTRMACEQAVNTVLSGPAAGVIAASAIAKQAGHQRIVTCDMGGTSFDVGLIVGGVPFVTSDRDLAFNLPMRIPIIDIHTIGAGGGSIAHINAAGMLQVGPRSAGARPGPIAYGRGGKLPTVTDANVLLGRLSAKQLLAVDTNIDLPGLRQAFAALGRPLALGAEQTAAAVIRVIDDAMAGAIRFVTLQRGFDPREFAIFAFGGAGPLHGSSLAREMGIPTVIVPYVPGLTCALGCIVADVRHDFVQTIGKSLADVTARSLRDVLLTHEQAGLTTLKREDVPLKSTHFVHEADMHYEGQRYTLRVRVHPDRLDVADLQEQLRKACFDTFGIDLSNFRARIANLRTAVIGLRPSFDLARVVAATHNPKDSVKDAVIDTRSVWFGDSFVETPVYQRELLPIGATIPGPAIFNQMDSTTVTAPDDVARVDELANLVIEVRK